MFTQKDIFIVKHVGCASCDELAASLPDLTSTIVGRGVSQAYDLCRLAKKITYKYNQTGRHAGYPFLVIKEKYVIPRPLALKVTESDLQLLVDVAEFLWLAEPYNRYANYAIDWLAMTKNRQQNYIEERTRMVSDIGFDSWNEISDIGQLCLSTQLKINDPNIEPKIVELILAGVIREIHGLIRT